MSEALRNFDAPIPGMSLTHELGDRPWQQPAQYPTVDEAIEYYMNSMTSEDFMDQIIDVLEMGVPVTNVANAMQTAGVLQGKHNIDVGMLILPVLVELLMLIGDTADIKYTSGLEKGKRIRSTLVDNAVERLKGFRNYEKTKKIPSYANRNPKGHKKAAIATDKQPGRGAYPK